MTFPTGCPQPRDDRCCTLSVSQDPCAAAAADPDTVLSRLWDEVRQAPELSGLVGMVPQGNPLTLADVMPLIMSALGAGILQDSGLQLALIDALGHAYARARGLHFVEED